VAFKPVVLSVAVCLLTGCGTGQEDDVRATAHGWTEAVAAGDWQAACDLLTPTTLDEIERSDHAQCSRALSAEHPLPSREPAPWPCSASRRRSPTRTKRCSCPVRHRMVGVGGQLLTGTRRERRPSP